MTGRHVIFFESHNPWNSIISGVEVIIDSWLQVGNIVENKLQGKNAQCNPKGGGIIVWGPEVKNGEEGTLAAESTKNFSRPFLWQDPLSNDSLFNFRKVVIFHPTRRRYMDG